MENPSNNLEKLINRVSALLSEANIDHALIGGIAIGLWGYPRSTIDVDFLIKGQHSNRVRAILEQDGFVCEAETGETLHFSGEGAVDFLIAKRPHSLNMLDNASNLTKVLPKVVKVEGIIGLKIQAYINDPNRKWKDQADIAELIRANPNLDWKQVMEYAKLFDQENTLKEMRLNLAP